MKVNTSCLVLHVHRGLGQSKEFLVKVLEFHIVYVYKVEKFNYIFMFILDLSMIVQLDIFHRPGVYNEEFVIFIISFQYNTVPSRLLDQFI